MAVSLASSRDSSSEFRHSGRPIAALQGLDRDGRVLYIGTFNKILFPALRLAYPVAPAGLVEPFALARAFSDGHSPILEQAAVLRFIEEGRFARHIARMRIAYRERQEALIEALHQKLAGVVEPEPGETGLHLVAWLRQAMRTTRVHSRYGNSSRAGTPIWNA